MSYPSLRHRDVLLIAVPIILSNISTPLLGIVDTAVLGQLGEAHLIGSIAVGAILFSMIFWGFGFLRMGTSGLTAQADGAGDNREVLATFYRALIIASGLGILVIFLQSGIARLSFYVLDASVEVEQGARLYFDIRIWSAPAALVNYTILGWLVGLGRAGAALFLQVILNGSNAVLDAMFVLVFGMEVEGVAIGTVIAEYIALFAGLFLIYLEVKRRGSKVDWPTIWNANAMRRIFTINFNIMIRTLCLIFAFSFFTAQSAKMDDIVLAANAILINFLQFSAHFLDGFAHAAQTLVGRAIGAVNISGFRQAKALSFLWAFATAIVLSAMFLFGGSFLVSFMTVNEAVRDVSNNYMIWLIIAPLVGVGAYQYDGIFVGATRTEDMRNMMILSLIAYLAAWFVLTPGFGNHGLWGSIMVFFFARTIALHMRIPALERDIFGGHNSESNKESASP